MGNKPGAKLGKSRMLRSHHNTTQRLPTRFLAGMSGTSAHDTCEPSGAAPPTGLWWAFSASPFSINVLSIPML
ncbi:hypothetical protein NL676_015327 [Syzygium grande]|nr:hypothetical protein NL676_015327 [Syzygium grande]